MRCSPVTVVPVPRPQIELRCAWPTIRSGVFAGETRLVAELVVTGGDSPWLYATVLPTPAFDELRPLFVEELRLLDRLDQDVEVWEAGYD